VREVFLGEGADVADRWFGHVVAFVSEL
jgi:hypothetical protein